MAWRTGVVHFVKHSCFGIARTFQVENYRLAGIIVVIYKSTDGSTTECSTDWLYVLSSPPSKHLDYP